VARTVAVTGAGGFIGRRLIERLCRDGDHVRALIRHRPIAADVPAHRLRIVKGSLDDPGALAELVDGADAVVHLAGLIKARRRRDFFDVNAEGVARLVRAICARASMAKLVMVSSLAAREPGLSSYATSKRAGEAVLLDRDHACPWTILRPPAVYGPGDRETLPFFKGIRRGFGAMLGGRDARFSLLHVDDLAAAIAELLPRGNADGLILELDDGTPGGHSWTSMIKAGERAMGVRARRLPVPPAVLYGLGGVNAALKVIPGYTPMLTPDKARELTHPDWVADCRPILNNTGWLPTLSIESGFRETVDWYQLHRWL
jgi:nucleoside-diphosphate-sugar epimerase